ncbi:unnamed protein product [Caenorhabditis auriculariae]|uniref:C2H2-type domain-containing protein n=1 Tax=Caenorhabditis auriculariae TaxID=2777116 RepID=A0A8S1HJ81_9PELO|nr:unnamed protein product [Caenorhabditis auriculariae]
MIRMWKRSLRMKVLMGRNNLNIPVGAYDCSMCSANFMTRCGMSKHMKKAHGCSVKSLFGAKSGPICSDCGEFLRSHLELSEHMNLAHGGAFRVVERDFETVSESEDWLEKKCMETDSKFYKTTVNLESDHKIVYRKCCLVGRYANKPRRNNRPKACDSCTAYVKMKIFNSGSVHLEACFDHSSHRLGLSEDTAELLEEIQTAGVPTVVDINVGSDPDWEKKEQEMVENREKQTGKEEDEEETEWFQKDPEVIEIDDSGEEEEKLLRSEEPEVIVLDSDSSDSEPDKLGPANLEHDYCCSKASPKLETYGLSGAKNNEGRFGWGLLSPDQIFGFPNLIVCPVDGCTNRCTLFRILPSKKGISIIRKCTRIVLTTMGAVEDVDDAKCLLLPAAQTSDKSDLPTMAYPHQPRSSTLFKAYVIASMTCLWTAYTLTVRYTRSTVPPDKMYSATTVVLSAEAVKLVITFLMLFRDLKGDFGDFQATLSKHYFGAPRELAKMSVPSIAYALQNNLDFVGLSNLDAGLYQVTTQLKVVSTALFMMAFLGRKFSGTRWAAIVLLMLGVAAVQKKSRENDEQNYNSLNFRGEEKN